MPGSWRAACELVSYYESSASGRASGQASLPVCASTCRAFIVNIHAALRAASPRMKARIAPCLRQSTLPLRSVLNKRSTFHFGRCWTRGLHSVPVVVGQAPLALSNTGTQQHWRLAPRNPASKYSRFPLPGGNSCSYFGVIKCADTGSSKLAPAPAHLIAFIVNFHAALRAAPPRMKAR